MNGESQRVLLSVRSLHVNYAVRDRGRAVQLHALQNVDFQLRSGEALAVIGESGSGKSTLARALLRLVAVAAGEVRFRGTDLLGLEGAALRSMRRHLQMIFQDGPSALDPRMQIGAILAEPLQVFRPELSGAERRSLAAAMLERVGLRAQHLERYPHEFSGGQAQRIGIARALIVEPELIVCDEPLSALDVSIKAQIAALLKSTQRQMHLALLFIAHDLPAVRELCDRVLVLYLGRTMEIAACEALFRAPRHPYTRALLQAVPIPDPRIARQHRTAPLGGEIPSALAPPSGCVFRTRCRHAIERCARELPLLRSVGESLVACHRAEEI
ncbi:MAG: oligopeptide/dipeptide ABC transporter ATP-binding protein [Steroidobacteraceae bacterium]|jgi:oligopeptide transport system ATP-binding protein